MSTTTLKNTHRAIYLKTSGSGSTEVFSRLGYGVNSFTPSSNPTVDTKHYIDASAPSHSITAVAKQYAFSADCIKGDACLDFIAGLDGATGDDCKTDMVDVDLSSSSGAGTTYSAKKYSVLVAVEQPYSVVGGENQQMSGTIYTNGDAVLGTFDTSTSKFTAST